MRRFIAGAFVLALTAQSAAAHYLDCSGLSYKFLYDACTEHNDEHDAEMAAILGAVVVVGGIALFAAAAQEANKNKDKSSLTYGLVQTPSGEPGFGFERYDLLKEGTRLSLALDPERLDASVAWFSPINSWSDYNLTARVHELVGGVTIKW